jgi:hypothetical protein
LISERIAGLYTKAEDKYFDALDFLDSKGIPVYKYSDFFENKGIPSFVVTIAIIVGILLLLTVALTYHGPDASSLIMSLKSADGQSLTNVKLHIENDKGEILFDGLANDGQTIQLTKGLYNGERISITATPQGYSPRTVDFTIGEQNGVASISFAKESDSTQASIRLVDTETKTIIEDATVFVEDRELSYQFNYDANGVYKKTGIPTGVTLIAKITAEGYNEYNQTLIFNSGEVKTIELTPSDQGYVGLASALINVKDADGKAIDDATVTVYDKTTQNILMSGVTQQGTVLGQIQTGKPLRIVIDKTGYLKYDSDVEGQSITLRKKESKIDVTLQKGGKKLHVTVLDSQSGFTIDGAEVQIYKTNLSFVEKQITSITGADFNGLNPLDKIYVTAYKEGYLAARQIVDVSSTDEVRLVLGKVNATNSARLEIYSVDPKGSAINGVKVIIYEIKDGNTLPYGIRGAETSFAGYLPITVANGATYQILGETEVMQGKATTEIKSTEVEKKVFLRMDKKPQIIEMRFIDLYGKNIPGNATIAGLDGTILFDGNLSDGVAFFDAGQREVVEIQVTLNDGNVFIENVKVKGKNYIEVLVYTKNAQTLSPLIEYVGLENENGESVQGITPGAFYWAKFSVTYPKAAAKGGVHFRAGADNVTFTDSEKFGLYDISIQNASITQSTSYSPTPAPGNEVIDRANQSLQGEKSKWIEGVVDAPLGTYTVKIKVRAEDFTEGKVQLRYRAWTIVGGEYYRAPEDTKLGTDAFNDTQSGLYANTNLQELTLYESLPDCTDNICLTTNFVDESENFLAESGFEALVGKTYGLEVQATAQDADYLQITATTDGNLIGFNSTQTGTFNFVREQNATTGSNKASAAITLTKEGKEKIRFYFKANNPGNVTIKVSAAGKSTVTKEVLFKTVNEKILLVELSEAQVMAGKNFTVKVADQGLKGIDKALVKIIDKEGKVAKSTVGDGTEGNGKNGYYRIHNDLSLGLYTVEVSLTGYATTTVPLLITTQNILTFTDSMEVKIPVGEKKANLSETLTNNSDFTVQNITLQIDSEATKDNKVVGQTTATTDSGKFKIIATVPAALASSQSQSVQLTISYLGDVNDTADETTKITISGLVEGKFLTKVSATIHLVYNRKLDTGCLKVNPENLIMNVLGSQDATDSATLEVTNNCDQAVFLKKRVRENTQRSLIIVNADDTIDLQPGETKNITITATNLVDRGNAMQLSFGYNLIYDANYLKKTINITVKTINPIFALQYPPQITLWLAQSSATQKAQAAQPVFLTNISSFPVDNIQLTVDREYGSGANIKPEIVPAGMISLQPGQSAQKLVFAQATSKISEPVRATITITGRLGNLNNRLGRMDRYGYYDQYYNGNNSLNNYSPNNGYAYNNGNYNYYNSINNGYNSSSGYYNGGFNNNYYNNYGNYSYFNSNQTLGQIQLMIYYSGYNCLTANLVSDVTSEYDLLSYILPDAGGQITKRIAITNKCAEPVRIVSATPAGLTQQGTANTMINPLGLPSIASSILLSVPITSIMPGQKINVPLTVMTAMPNIKREKYGVVVNAISEVSQTQITSQPFFINIKTGSSLAEEHIKATKVKLKVCGTGGTSGTMQEEEVLMPNTASQATPNCAEKYCDSRQAAKYMELKIRDVISKARSAGYQKKNEESDFGSCQTEGACTFEEIGMVTDDTIKLYLQNDDLTPAILQKELNSIDMEGVNTTPFRETTGLSTGFTVEPAIVDVGFLKARAIAGYDRTIFLDRAINGCGYYELKITGAFRATPQGLETSTPVLLIITNHKTPRLVTGQCNNSIINIANFNPVDDGLNSGSDYGTWLTTIDTDPLLKDMATQIAKTRYKSDKRVTNGSGNKVKLTRGPLTLALAQVCMSGDTKKTINVTVSDTITTQSQTKKDALTQQVTTMISDALNGSFGQENCVIKSGDNYACVNLISPGGSGSRRIELMDNGKISLAKSTDQYGSCVEGTIYSNVPELLNLDTELGIGFMGVRRISVLATNDDKFPKAKIIQATDGTQDTTTNTPTNSNNIPTVDNTTVNKEANKKDTAPTPTPTGATPISDKTIKTSAVEQEQRISFADTTTSGATTLTNPTAPQPTLTDTTKTTPPDLYYQLEIMGGDNSKVIVTKPIELKKNQNAGSKDYQFFRNIRVCINQTDGVQNKEPEQTDKTPIKFSLANGKKFTLEIKPTSDPTRIVDKKIVEISSGTIHPDDLVRYICSIANNPNAKGDFSTYFTITWNGDGDRLAKADDPNTLELGKYIEGLKRKGKLDDCTIFTGQSGYGGTGSANKVINDAKAMSVYKYLGACTAVSGTCGAVFGITTLGLGTIVNGLLDCGIPALTTYRKDLAASSTIWEKFFTSIQEFTKPVQNVPIIGDLIKSMLNIKEEIDTSQPFPIPAKQIITDSVLKTLITQGFSRTFNSWPASAANQGITSKLANLMTGATYDKLTGKGLIEQGIEVSERIKTPAAITGLSRDTAAAYSGTYATAFSGLDGSAVAKFEDIYKKAFEKKMQELMTKDASTQFQKLPVGAKRSLFNISTYSERSIGLSYGQSALEAAKQADAAAIDAALNATDKTGATVLQRLAGGTKTTSMEKIIESLTANPVGSANYKLGKALEARGLNIIGKDAFDARFRTLLESSKTTVPKEIDQVYDKVTKTWKDVPISFEVDSTMKPQFEALFKQAGLEAEFVTEWPKIQAMGVPKGATNVDNYVKSIAESIAKKGGSAEELAQLKDTFLKMAEKDVKKIGEASKLKVGKAELMNKFKSGIKSLGVGLGCSTLANLIGEQVHDQSYNANVKGLEASAANTKLIINKTLVRGQTYELKADSSYGGVAFTPIINEVESAADNEAKLIKTRANKGKTITYEDTKELVRDLIEGTRILPEQRKLSLWYLQADTSTAKLKENTTLYPADSTIQATELKVLRDEKTQILILEYTPENGRYKIRGADEGLIIATLLFDGPKEIYGQLMDEGKNFNGKLREKVSQVVTALSTSTVTDQKGNKTLSTEDIRKIFKWANDSQAKDFIKYVSFWREISNSASPNIQPTIKTTN